jgi:hypothetical protein
MPHDQAASGVAMRIAYWSFGAVALVFVVMLVLTVMHP